MRIAWLALGMLAAIMNGPATSEARGTGPDSSIEEGTGQFPAVFEEDPTLPAHVVYRPRDLHALGSEKLPVYVWGNGGCSADGTSSRNHLLEIASHGYLVIAAGSIPADKPAPAAPPQQPRQLSAATPTSALLEAVDWAIRENQRPGSHYAGRIAVDRIAVSGWSCGGLQALNVAGDPRVKTAVIMNSGFFPANSSPIAGVESDKATLAKLHTPVLYILGGATDIAYQNGMDDYRRIAGVPAAVINIAVGHGGTYSEPHGGLAAQIVVNWLDWQLKGVGAAGLRFAGPGCGYCGDPRVTIERKGLDKP
ncbi:hypothetical protein [Sphingomonas sp.]|uniref:hypothetical protein n=1 Tax=Sphingomonas sp. TaxID=28214 RepID=UPI001B2E565C|nr:hypothetical protein [Sphingomonas sp.]MBO9711707.1 hypothetical protein [Sphingomonas sp.]